MPDSPAVSHPPDPIWRVERIEPPLRFSRINAVDAARDRAGNRFDIPGAGVLYGATTVAASFAETIAYYRSSASLIAKLVALGAPLPPHDGVPASWRHDRRIRQFTVIDALPFVDIESPVTHTYLKDQAYDVLVARGVDTLDVAQVRGPSRLLTRSLAAWLYSRTDEHGSPLYGGIRYVSRLGDYECWAIFDGTNVRLNSSDTIAADHPQLAEVAATYGLTVEQ